MIDIFTILAEATNVTPQMRAFGVFLFILYVSVPLILFCLYIYILILAAKKAKTNPKKRKYLIILSILAPFFIFALLFFF